MQNCIEIKDLSFSFGATKILDNIQLTVPNNSIYGFLGPNGAGKSTTIRCILQLLRPKKGAISIFGYNAVQHRQKILSNIGATIENPSLYGHLSAFDNLKITQTLIKAPVNRIPKVLSMVGLSEKANQKTSTFSLGMKQRLSIAMALLNDPELLILDEPMNGLDPSGINEMRHLILSLQQNHGKTIFLSSHILSEIEKTATHIGIINKGKIVAETNLAEMLNQNSFPHILQTNNNEKTLSILNSLGLTPYPYNDKIEVVLHSKTEIAQINARIVQEGIDLYQSAPSENELETIFLQTVSN